MTEIRIGKNGHCRVAGTPDSIKSEMKMDVAGQAIGLGDDQRRAGSAHGQVQRGAGRIIPAAGLDLDVFDGYASGGALRLDAEAL
jgi:hypothetical protein